MYWNLRNEVLLVANLGIEGLDVLMAKLDKLGGNAEEALRSGVEKATRRVKRDAKLLCPVDNGKLRNSIQHKVEKFQGKVEGLVFTNMEYAAYVEFGTGPKGEASQAIRPSGISYKQDPWFIPVDKISADTAEKYHFQKIKVGSGEDAKQYYICYGQPAHPFLYPALIQNQENIKKDVTAVIKAALKEVCKK